MTRRLIVTRPEPDASRWAQALSDQGFDALALPLIAIAPPPDMQAVLQARQQLGHPGPYQAAMFVSSQAVAAFFKPNWPLAHVFIAQTAIENIAVDGSIRCWATGPGTRQALLQAGVPAAQIDAPADHAAQFDSEALWHIVAPQITPGQRVLLVRGGNAEGVSDGRDWLAQQLQACGAQVDTLVAYRRCPPTPDAALLSRATQAPALWLFSSSQAVAHWQTLFARVPAKACALATHARIAQAARAAGFAVVYESRPLLADVIAAIESIA